MGWGFNDHKGQRRNPSDHPSALLCGRLAVGNRMVKIMRQGWRSRTESICGSSNPVMMMLTAHGTHKKCPAQRRDSKTFSPRTVSSGRWSKLGKSTCCRSTQSTALFLQGDVKSGVRETRDGRCVRTFFVMMMSTLMVMVGLGRKGIYITSHNLRWKGEGRRRFSAYSLSLCLSVSRKCKRDKRVAWWEPLGLLAGDGAASAPPWPPAELKGNGSFLRLAPEGGGKITCSKKNKKPYWIGW